MSTITPEWLDKWEHDLSEALWDDLNDARDNDAVSMQDLILQNRMTDLREALEGEECSAAEPEPPLYIVDIYLKSGSVMRDVTVHELNFKDGGVSWRPGGDRPLVMVTPEDVSGVVRTEKVG